MKGQGILLPVLCHVFASALEMKCSLNANSCCWLTGSNKAWPPIVIYVKMGYITCSDFDGFVSQTEPSTLCKITKFARKMGGQNFHKFNAVLTSRDHISPLQSEISVLLPLHFELECILVRKFHIFSSEMADFVKVSLRGFVMT